MTVTAMRNSNSWYSTTPGGVRLTVIRRTGRDQFAGGWEFLEFDGPDEAGCEAAYDDYCMQGQERSVRQAERRSHWGPLGTGRMT